MADNIALEVQNGRNIVLVMAEFKRRIVGMRKYLQELKFKVHADDC